jgi:hypothetical protein
MGNGKRMLPQFPVQRFVSRGISHPWRLGLLATAVGWVLNGKAAAVESGPAFVFAQVVVLPFAVFWVRGGLAVLRAVRGRRASAGATG